jgi:hypothetical protein
MIWFVYCNKPNEKYKNEVYYTINKSLYLRKTHHKTKSKILTRDYIFILFLLCLSLFIYLLCIYYLFIICIYSLFVFVTTHLSLIIFYSLFFMLYLFVPHHFYWLDTIQVYQVFVTLFFVVYNLFDWTRFRCIEWVVFYFFICSFTP